MEKKLRGIKAQMTTDNTVNASTTANAAYRSDIYFNGPLREKVYTLAHMDMYNSFLAAQEGESNEEAKRRASDSLHGLHRGIHSDVIHQCDDSITVEGELAMIDPGNSDLKQDIHDMEDEPPDEHTWVSGGYDEDEEEYEYPDDEDEDEDEDEDDEIDDSSPYDEYFQWDDDNEPPADKEGDDKEDDKPDASPYDMRQWDNADEPEYDDDEDTVYGCGADPEGK